MDLQALIETHGYWLLAVGCLLEGETVLLLAGFAARRGHLDPVAVVVIAALAGFAGDEIFFWLGRRHGAAVLARWPRLLLKVARVQALMARFHDALVVFVRFAYGLRVAGPIIIGMSTMPAVRFAIFNALGAVLWACLVGGTGWVFGQAAEAWLGELRSIEGWLLLALLAVGASVGLWHRWRRRRAQVRGAGAE
jgi:membrane protein DedA with SNARE-associated domain